MSTQRPDAIVSAVRDFPVTVFTAKEGQDNFGVFSGKNVDVWLRLKASHAVTFNPATKEWDNQWGQIVCFDALAKKIATLINNDPNGRLSMRIYAKQEVTVSVKDTQIYMNAAWLVWGFEYQGVFYTTRDGVVVQSDPRVVRGEQPNQPAKDHGDLNAAITSAAKVDEGTTVPEGYHLVPAYLRKNPDVSKPKYVVKG